MTILLALLVFDRGLDNFMSMMQGSMLKPVTSQSMLHVHGEDPKPTGSPATLGDRFLFFFEATIFWGLRGRFFKDPLERWFKWKNPEVLSIKGYIYIHIFHWGIFWCEIWTCILSYRGSSGSVTWCKKTLPRLGVGTGWSSVKLHYQLPWHWIDLSYQKEASTLLWR